eukprot:COSAG02_NODE_12834_length_1485_cov_2.007937_2_plen_79_part_01
MLPYIRVNLAWLLTCFYLLKLNHIVIYAMGTTGYVNAIAALSIRSAIDVSTSLGLPVPANWSEIVDGLHIPFDEDRQYH